jgi:hypothetical protein
MRWNAAFALGAVAADATSAAAVSLARAGISLDAIATAPVTEGIRSTAGERGVAGSPRLATTVERVATRLSEALTADRRRALARAAAAIAPLLAAALIRRAAAEADHSTGCAGGIRLAGEARAADPVAGAWTPVCKAADRHCVDGRASLGAVDLAAISVPFARGTRVRTALGPIAVEGSQATGLVGTRSPRAAGVGALFEQHLLERAQSENRNGVRGSRRGERRQDQGPPQPRQHERNIARRIRRWCNP